jgi:hypothetical protein
VFLTSLLLLVTAVVLIVWGAITGSVQLLAASVGCGAAGAVALLVANALAPRLAKAGVTGPGQEPVADSAGAGGAAATPTSNGSATPVALSPWAAADAPPIPGYDEMTAAQVVRVVRTGSLATPALAALLSYEASHEGRATVITSLERALGLKAGAR